MEHGFDKASDEAGADIILLMSEKKEELYRAILQLQQTLGEERA